MMAMRTTPVTRWSELPQPFLAREAFEVGLTSGAIAGAVRRREIIPVARSVYAVPDVWTRLDARDTHRALTRAAVVSVPDAVASHQSAAIWWGLPSPLGPIGRPTVTVPESQRSSADHDWRRVLHGELPVDHVTLLDGLAVTTATRTVVDCLRVLRFRDSLAAADAALGAGVVTVDGLEQMRCEQARWPGIRTVDAALPLADARRESWLESASVAVAWTLGFSRPESQVWIHRLDGQLVGRVDLLWRAAGVVGEADGQGKYQGDFDDDWDRAKAGAFMVAERDRERALESLGFAVARWDTSALLHGGRGLDSRLREAGRRANPGRIRCLWRHDPKEPLRYWGDGLAIDDSGNGPSAA